MEKILIPAVVELSEDRDNFINVFEEYFEEINFNTYYKSGNDSIKMVRRRSKGFEEIELYKNGYNDSLTFKLTMDYINTDSILYTDRRINTFEEIEKVIEFYEIK